LSLNRPGLDNAQALRAVRRHSLLKIKARLAVPAKTIALAIVCSGLEFAKFTHLTQSDEKEKPLTTKYTKEHEVAPRRRKSQRHRALLLKIKDFDLLDAAPWHLPRTPPDFGGVRGPGQGG